MKLAVCLYKYFPFGGLARDFMRIMTLCRGKGAEIDVYVMQWQGEVPEGFNVHVLPGKAWTNHGKVNRYIQQVKPKLAQGNYDLIIGFNKIPDLDLYYAADPCYLDRVKNHPRYFLHKLTQRVRFYSQCEQAVFGSESNTVSLMISDIQQALFKRHYQTSEARLISLPPGIDPDRKQPENWLPLRQQFRQQYAIKPTDFVLLMVGTGFKTKGLDRAIASLASVPESLKNRVKLFVIGEGDTRPYQKIAQQLSVDKQITFFGGRGDIPYFLNGTDLLLHPARKENTGTVILEAIVSGLPVIVTDICGYAKHVIKSKAGKVVDGPFKQSHFDRQLIEMLDGPKLKQWSGNALAYAEVEDLYSMPEKAAAIIEQMANKEKKESHH